MTQPKHFFSGLDSIRAIAAFSVIIGHVELIKSENGISNLMHLRYFQTTSGHTGVVLFFVLSGFLITHLLLREKEQTNSISFKNFYLKRLLRVWPLYFLILVVSLILFNYSPSFLTLILSLTIFPNVAHALGQGWEPSPQLWSIGVEEQFYLVHPLLISVAKKYLLPFLVLFFIVYTFLPQFIICSMQPSANVESFIRNFSYGSKYNCMALGGICAILYSHKKYARFTKQVLSNKIIGLILLVLPFVLWILAYPIYLNDTIQICYTKIEVTQEVFACLFGLQILTIVSNDFIANLVSWPFLNYLGKISYGLYMFHWIVLLLVVKLALPVFAYNSTLGNFLMYGLTIVLSIAIAALSFKYFESIFQRLRNKLIPH